MRLSASVALSVLVAAAVVAPQAPASLAASPAAATRAAARPAPHPVLPQMQTLTPHGVDATAFAAMKAADEPRVVDRATPAVATGPTTTRPFQLVGLTWDTKGAPAGIALRVRVRTHGAWGAWHALGVEDGGPDADTAEGRRAAATQGSEPLLSDSADGVQVVVKTATCVVPPGLRVDLVDPGTSAADGEQPSAATASVTDGGAASAAPAAAQNAPAQAALAQAGAPTAPLGTASPERVGSAPTVITRAQWGADESIRKPVDWNATVKAFVIHHTDTTNGYHSLAAAERQVRAVYAFHVKGRHWSDIGYNFVVDRFGHIFEGRAGSISKAVLGAHTGGFNTSTIGIAALGTFTTPHPPAKMVSAIAKVVAWKAGQYAVPLNGHVHLTSAGGGTSRYKAGTRIRVRNVTGHRTFGHTTCPGNALWAKLSSIRHQAGVIKAKRPSGTGYWPVSGVWTAGGGVQPGWFRNGVWTLRKPDGSRLRIAYGGASDVPVVGDWDGDGVTGIGVFRSGRWLLSNELRTTHQSDVSFTFGQTGDLPVVGRWPGTAQLGVGVERSNLWSLRDSLTSGPADASFRYGRIGDLPVVADWDGDGFTTVGLQRLGRTWLLHEHANTGHTTRTYTYGVFGAVPSVGDWDGNHTVTPATVRGDRWYIRNDLQSAPHSRLVTFSPS